MDRRQLLFGVAVLTLVTLPSFDNLLVAQVGNTTVSTVRLSDREKAGLRGPIKTYSDFFGDDADPMSHAEYSADGRLLVWRGRLVNGEVEQVYSYDATGKLISGTYSGSGVTDEFHYDEQGKKTRVRTVPPRSRDRGAGLSGPFVFGNAEEGDCLTGGGSVTTRYNDEDQPIESLVRDSHEELLGKIVHNYTNGRLISETLVWVRLELASELRELPPQEFRVAEAQMKQAMSEMGLNNIERSYVYDDKGRVVGRLFRAGDVREETTTSYNEHGDVAGTVRIERCIDRIIHNSPIWTDCRSEASYLYEYDSHGNWTERTEKTVDGSVFSAIHRKLTYY
jgi:hypothetical protein